MSRMGWWPGSLSPESAQRQIPLVVGPVALDVLGCRALVEGRVIHLPAREAAILEVLMRNPGRVMLVSELCAAIGERADRGEHVARWARRLARRLVLSPLLAPLIESVGIESVGDEGYRYTSTEFPAEERLDV
ncbi:MAG TPA: hypothetical protein VFO16_18600 [Pseudonocardiaceae bacterium]|nr:hypothetical protein [Pseudonocardiaceae bacterium]